MNAAIHDALARYESAAAELQAAIAGLDEAVRQAADDWRASAAPRLRCIIETVALHFGLPVTLLRAPVRRANVVEARQAAAAVAYGMGESPAAIAHALSRHWQTVGYAVRVVCNREDLEPVFAAEMKVVRAKVRAVLAVPPAPTS